MSLALKELRRRPGRFLIATAVLTFIVLLITMLGGLLDGLFLGSTGALRAQDAELVVYSADSRDQLLRSQIDPKTRAIVAAVPGVATTSGIGVALVGVRVPDQSTLADGAVFGYEGNVRGVPAPPPAGEAYVDRRLEANGVRLGQTLQLGRSAEPVVVKGWVEDTSYLLQGGIWVAPEVWRRVLVGNRPDLALAPGTFQALTIQTAPGAKPASVAAAIGQATNNTTSTLTVHDAIYSSPGIKQQASTFNGIIYTTILVAVLIVGLFFALITIERTALYGVFKAIGASSRQIVFGLFAQATVTAVVAFTIGAGIAYGFAALVPPSFPLIVETTRTIQTLFLIEVAALIGAAISIRRVIKIDPASAIGGGA
ncbi:MAG: ABC transporter permease [Acidimicrobiia bacterium]